MINIIKYFKNYLFDLIKNYHEKCKRKNLFYLLMIKERARFIY